MMNGSCLPWWTLFGARDDDLAGTGFDAVAGSSRKALDLRGGEGESIRSAGGHIFGQLIGIAPADAVKAAGLKI